MKDDDQSGHLRLTALAELRALLLRMEEDLGLGNLNRVERDMVYASRAVADAEGRFSSHDLRNHSLLARISTATFHRSLNRLAECGFIRHADGSLARNYVILNR